MASVQTQSAGDKGKFPKVPDPFMTGRSSKLGGPAASTGEVVPNAVHTLSFELHQVLTKFLAILSHPLSAVGISDDLSISKLSGKAQNVYELRSD
jgi:hypothetical protein